MNNLYTRNRPESRSNKVLALGVITIIIAVLILIFGKRNNFETGQLPTLAPTATAPKIETNHDPGTPLLFAPGPTEKESTSSSFILPKELQ